MEVLFITENRYPWCKQAKAFLDLTFGEENVLMRTSAQKYVGPPEDLIDDAKDLLISALNPWVIPQHVLDAHALAINFHPGPPAYPGTGGYNFAVYDGAELYGATCHIMNKHVDAGPIVRTVLFDTHSGDTPYTLQQRTHTYMLTMFYEVIESIVRRSLLCKEWVTPSGEQWGRKAYIRHDLEDLCRITQDMSEDEVAKRIRATTYPDRPGAFVEVGGHIFEHIGRDRTKIE